MQKLKDENDIKIFILYLMRHIGYPLSYSTITDIVLQDGFVNSFDFIECFAALAEAEIVTEIKGEGNESLYEISEKGIGVIDNLESSLLSLIKEKSLKSAVRLLDFRKSHGRLNFDYDSLPNDRYAARLSFGDDKEDKMKIEVILESKYQLEKVKQTFVNNPEAIYKGMLSLITGEIEYLIND